MDLREIMPTFTPPVSNVTKETRKASYNSILDDLGERQQNVLLSLQKLSDGATAKELAVYMKTNKLVMSAERNSVHPRLNELIKKGLVEVVGKKTCRFTGRRVAIYKCK